jgi:DNA-binding XRE family transcriptional regulator
MRRSRKAETTAKKGEIMTKKRENKNGRTAANRKRERAIRSAFRRSRPSLESLVKSGEFSPPIKQGEYLILMRFAAMMKQARKERQLSLTQVATRSGIDKAALSRFENALADNPTIGTLNRIARSLGKRVRIELEDERHAGA